MFCLFVGQLLLHFVACCIQSIDK